MPKSTDIKYVMTSFFILAKSGNAVFVLMMVKQIVNFYCSQAFVKYPEFIKNPMKVIIPAIATN